jgi:hypothetical protein
MWALIGLGHVRLRQNERLEAEELFRESLEIVRELGTRKRISLALEGLAEIAVERAREETAENENRRHSWLVRAARLLGAAETQREIGRNPLPTMRMPEHERLVMRASQLSPETFATEFEEGKSLPLHELVLYALQSPL